MWFVEAVSGSDCYLFLTMNHMGLDLVPTLDPCVLLDHLADLPGVTIELDPSFACPLKGASRIQGGLGNDCWCRGKVAAGYLEWLGHGTVGSALYDDYEPGEAVDFGEDLLNLAAELRTKYPECDKPRSDSEEVITIGKTGHRFNLDELNEALDAIED